MTAKLTLSVEADVVRRAKRHARLHRTSLSSMVERFLALVSTPPDAPATSGALRDLRGVLKHGDREAYRRHLREKHL
jgi:Family of unknown function (DUF6364)